MKKITILFLLAFSAISMNVSAQTDYAIAMTGASSTQLRGPQGAYRYHRSVWVITAAEMAASGYVNNDVINALAFNFIEALDAPATGTIKLYMQNTTDATNLKSTTWTTAITGMTMLYNGPVTLPATTGQFVMPYTTNFTYTGGGVYVAFDYQNPSGTLPTVPSTLNANNTISPGTKSANNATAAPATIAASAFRPETIFGKLVPCARPTNVAVSNATDDTATITFNSSSPVNIEYGPYDFTPGTGTTVTGVTSPYVLSGLTVGTAYEIYLKANCGGTAGLSSTTVPVSFHTNFYPVTPTYTTSFEVDDFPNMGWLADPEPNGSDWFINYGGTTSALVQNGSYSVVALANATATSAGRLYSRGINLTEGSTVTIEFYARNYQATSTNSSSYALSVGDQPVEAAQSTVIGSESVASTAFALKSYTYTTPATGVYYFSFLNNSPVNATGTNAIIIDNLTITEALKNNEFLQSKISTFPNPANTVVNISNPTSALINTVELTDVNGRVVKSNKYSNVSNVQLNISDLSQGVYVMRIVSDQGLVTKKVVKE